MSKKKPLKEISHYHRKLAAWEDQKFSSKDAIQLAPKRIVLKPDLSATESDMPASKDAGLLDSLNVKLIEAVQLKKEEQAKRKRIESERDLAEFTSLKKSKKSASSNQTSLVFSSDGD
jgi:hypothetical protein